MQITDMQSTTLTLTLIRHSESNRYKPIIANKETRQDLLASELVGKYKIQN